MFRLLDEPLGPPRRNLDDELDEYTLEGGAEGALPLPPPVFRWRCGGPQGEQQQQGAWCGVVWCVRVFFFKSFTQPILVVHLYR
jgi:hypothetical protein